MEKLNYIVYKTTNLITQKYYIGVHKQLGSDFDGYLGSGVAITRSIDKHGANNFTRETLYSFESRKEALLKESELVDEKLVNSGETYNLQLGGVGSFELCHTDEARTKAVDTRRRRAEERGGYIGDHLNTPESRSSHNESIKSKYGKIGGQLITEDSINKSLATRLSRYGSTMHKCHEPDIRSIAANKSKLTKLERYGDPMGKCNLPEYKLKARITRDQKAVRDSPELLIVKRLMLGDSVVFEGTLLEMLKFMYGNNSVKLRGTLISKLDSEVKFRSGAWKGHYLKVESATTKLDSIESREESSDSVAERSLT